MVLEPGRIFAQTEMVRDNAPVSRAVDQITRADLFARGGLKLYPLLIDLNAGDLGLLARHGTIMDGKVVKVSVGILTEPMILVPSTRAKLKAFLPIVDLTRPVKDITEVTFDAATSGDVFGEALGVDQMLQLREFIFLGQD